MISERTSGQTCVEKYEIKQVTHLNIIPNYHQPRGIMIIVQY